MVRGTRCWKWDRGRGCFVYLVGDVGLEVFELDGGGFCVYDRLLQQNHMPLPALRTAFLFAEAVASRPTLRINVFLEIADGHRRKLAQK